MKNNSWIKHGPPALFVGRFQPFHNGHADALKQVFAKEKYVIICIGSAEDDYLPENPFTAGERHQMIDAVLQSMKIDRGRYAIIPVRNVKHYSLWVKHMETLLPPFGAVYTGSSVTAKLFADDGKYLVSPIKKRLNISATTVRKLMLKDRGWKKLVPPSTARLIEEWKGEERIKMVSL